MNDEILAQLRDEVSKGQKATAAYVGYVREFVEKFSETLYGEFVAAETDEQSMKVKRKHDALMSLESAILFDIETGRLASNQLEENKQE